MTKIAITIDDLDTGENDTPIGGIRLIGSWPEWENYLYYEDQGHDREFECALDIGSYSNLHDIRSAMKEGFQSLADLISECWNGAETEIVDD